MAEKKYNNIVAKMREHSNAKEPVMVTMEHKYSDDLALTPEQLQAQQDEYDQWTSPSVEPVDFEAERESYLTRHQIREEIADNPGHEFGH